MPPSSLSMHRIAPLLAGLTLVLAPAAADAKGGSTLPKKWAKKHDLGRSAVAKDPDRDGLPNLAEFLAGTNPRKADSDRDGVHDTDEDGDHDKVDNGSEVLGKTDPGDADSDGDGRKDGKEDADRDGLNAAAEDATGHLPLDKDSDDDGVKDGAENAGVIKSIDDEGLVTIALATGGTVKAWLTGDTEVLCGDEEGYEAGEEPEGDEPVDDEELLEEEPLDEIVEEVPGGEFVFDAAEEDDEAAEEDDEEDVFEDEEADEDSCEANLEEDTSVNGAAVSAGEDGPELSQLKLLVRNDG